MRWRLTLLAFAAACPATALAQSAPGLPPLDRLRLVEADRLAQELRAAVWPGWERTPMPVLLVTASAEFLVGHPSPSPEFSPITRDSILRREVWFRPPRFSPTLLATFPAVGGQATIVAGPADRTGKSSVGWVLTLLHEHFHQWQYSLPDYYERVAGLGLAGGDTTGRWMLDYPFPYDSTAVQQAMRRFARTLGLALNAPADARTTAVRAVVDARDELRRTLDDDDYRYFDFQLWQEGTARFIEFAVARAAARAGRPPGAVRRLPDIRSYGETADEARRTLIRDLETLDLARQRRIAFYPLGAAVAALLEQTRPDWRRAYQERPFALAALLQVGR